MQLTHQQQLRSESDPAIIANLQRKGWVETVPPSYDAATQHAPEWVSGAWVVRDKIAEELRKVWPNVQSFMAAFTMQEKAAIALSTDPTIAALRLELTTWLSQVLSNDSRVQMGLNKLVELGILTEQRKQEILLLAA